MTDAMEALFAYAQEHLVGSLLEQEPEYNRISSCIEKQEETFRAMLAGEAAEHFDKLREEHRLLVFLYERALFRAGFQAALELLH